MGFAKGERVKITEGKSEGITGEIFWVGENKYGPGQRFGIRGDDGDTHWAAEDQCEASEEVMELPDGPELSKGDRVAWTDGDSELEGEVFWLGPNKYGPPGTRVGIKDDDGETHWHDSRKLTKVDEGRAPAAHPDGPSSGSAFDRPPAFDGGPSYDYGAPPPDAAPPIDDDWANSVGEPEGVDDDDIPF